MTDKEDKAKIAHDKEMQELRNRLIKATFAISEQVNTALRSLVDQYSKHMNASLRHNGDSEFPRAPKPHHFYPERTQCHVKGDVLCFHIGNAVMGLYHAANTGDSKLFRDRVMVVENIAAKHVGNFAVMGDDRLGFYLGEKPPVGQTFSENEIAPD